MVQPLDDPEVDEGEVVIMSVEEEQGDEVYVPVADEKLAQAVFEEFLLILESDDEE